jgi:hypothetical protein
MENTKTVAVLLGEEICQMILEGISNIYDCNDDDSPMRKEFYKLLDFSEKNNNLHNVPIFMNGYIKIFKRNLFQLIDRYLVEGLDVLFKKTLSDLYQETLEMMPFYLEYNHLLEV